MSVDVRDVVGGMLLLIGGAAFSLYGVEHYPIGSLRQMGPGMVPVALGVILAAFGVLLVVPALFRRGTLPEMRLWTPLFILISIAGFALTIETFGLIPAVLTTIILSSLAELRVQPLGLAGLCVGMSLLAWLVFSVSLGMSFPLIAWPF